MDVLFASAAGLPGSRVLAVVLTGIGNDRMEGAAVRAGRGEVLVESAATCVVYGMPRSVVEADLATREAPIGEMAALIVEHSVRY